MIIENPEQLTAAVLAELQRAKDPRVKEIMSAVVRHLHDLVRELRVTQKEFIQACGFIAGLGQHTTESHNEVVLLAGSLGVSTLVCLLNNGEGGRKETTANLLGPFWRLHSPRAQSGESIVRSPTPGTPLFVTVSLRDGAGKPIAQADVDVWQCSSEGFYENQDPGQGDMNLRGNFTSDAQGRVWFRSIMPSGYPIPVDGPVGDLLRAFRRHNMRPAHLHFMVVKPGYKTHITQVYVNADEHLETDVQFGVTRATIGNYVRHEDSAEAPATDVTGAWYSLDCTFVIEPGVTELPRPPITGKARGERPVFEVLKRS
jgi:hydroxyquinol 1,2-dioxygenase